MGDVLTLIDKAQETMDTDAARESAERMLKAQFTLEDFLTQLREMQKLGPIQDLLKMLPGVPGARTPSRSSRARSTTGSSGAPRPSSCP